MVCLFLLLLLLLLLLSPSSIANDAYKLCEGDSFSANTTFQSNLNLLLSSLSSKTNSTFDTDTQGSPPDILYGLFLCRGDVDVSTCHNCIQNATRTVLQLCPYSKQATIWYDTCQLRYSDRSFFATFHEDYPVRDLDKRKAKDPETFNRIRRQLFEKLYEQAANNSTLLFATGTAYIGVSENVMYGLVQCTRDLSKEGCSLCLQENFYDNSQTIDSQNTIGVRYLAKSCNFRFDVYKFFEGDPVILLSSSQPSTPVPSSHPFTPNAAEDGRSRNGNRKTIIISIVISLLAGSVLILAAFIISRRRPAKSSHGIADPDEIPVENLYFELHVLKVATANFSDVNKLGQGGFGAVYKGMLPNGQDIAVKRLSANSKQGIEELKNELLLVAKLQHRNLVRLQGVCLEGGEKLLVYEYMPNGSLDKFLFDPIKCKELDWERRIKIIEGIARGILYLHEESHLKVIHRDLKPSNILLDANLKPKISDFGLARLFGGDESQGITCRVVGTFGYMAPEYARRGRFSTKLDVYSYGILVLEIVTGRKIGTFTYDSEHSQDLLSYTWKHWRNGTALEIIDPSLGENYPRNELLRCIQIGLLCAQDDAADRPSMSSVFLMLNSPSMPLEDPLLPAYLTGSSMASSDVSSKGSSIQSHLGYTDISSTSNSQVSASSMGRSSQHSSTPNQPETKQKGKGMVHTDLMSNRRFNRSREQALPSRLSMTEPAGHPTETD